MVGHSCVECKVREDGLLFKVHLVVILVVQYLVPLITVVAANTKIYIKIRSVYISETPVT